MSLRDGLLEVVGVQDLLVVLQDTLETRKVWVVRCHQWAFVACRLIPLDKQPGVRPIGICEVLRRIVGKAVLKVVSPDVLRAAGPLQLCAGQDAGCEAAVHALRELFEQADTDAVLLVDASNDKNERED